MRRLAFAAVLLLAPARALAVYQCGDQKDTCQCGMDNPYPCCDNGGNCTWYAWEAACCAWGVGLPGWGNANQWHGNAAANQSFRVLSYPVTSSISNRDVGTYGHVAFVSSLNGGGNITVHEENCWGNYGMDTANYSSSYFTGGFIVPNGNTACQPGQTQTQSCGNCGTQSRSCGNDGNWNGWSACSSEGACAPGDSQSASCGSCGQHARTCSSSCQWQDWSACEGPDPVDAGACDAGIPGPCGVGAYQCVDGELACAQVVNPQEESCNGVDDDCNGTVDDEGTCPPDAGPSLADAEPTIAPRQLWTERPDAPVMGSCETGVGGSGLLALGLALLALRKRQGALS